MAFLAVNNFFFTDQKNICASIVSKAGKKPKHEKKIGGVFFKNQKRTFSGVQISTF